VDRLAPRTRAAVVLRYYADMTVRDVADALGTSENTVKTQLREALVQMRRTLGEEGDGGPRSVHAVVETGEATRG
jgi:DNA-directed RNA polymerase specialized sigma24 family protein